MRPVWREIIATSMPELIAVEPSLRTRDSHVHIPINNPLMPGAAQSAAGGTAEPVVAVELHDAGSGSSPETGCWAIFRIRVAGLFVVGCFTDRSTFVFAWTLCRPPGVALLDG
jgi:hypothetical protein